MFHLNTTLFLKVKNSYLFRLAKVAIIRLASQNIQLFLTFKNRAVFRWNILILVL
jgi:hypothetical protein